MGEAIPEDSDIPESENELLDFDGLRFGNIVFSGEGGVAWFHKGREGKYPNDEFRVDEAKVFADVKLRDKIYLFSELNVTLREEPEDVLRLGELYVDFENILEVWDIDQALGVRVGRVDIPFGLEYQVRDAIDNRLITHSLADFWGIDEGVLLYGGIERFDYVLAVQNGGHPALRDFNSDKSVTVRLGYRPNDWLYGSVSAMRTGKLDVGRDKLSELWFGNGFIRSLGDPATTTAFESDLLQTDLQFFLPKGYFKLAGGVLGYRDNDLSSANERTVHFYSVEALHEFNQRWYAASRFSQILASDGFPIVGAGPFGLRFFRTLTTDLWQWSLGGGYRWSDDLVLKLEYSLLRGEELGGKRRDNEDLVAAALAYGF